MIGWIGNMKDQLNVYPGKVLQYPRNLILEQDETPPNLYKLLRAPHWNQPGCWDGSRERRSLRQSLEDISLSKTSKDKRKPKLSLKLVRRLSRLLSLSKEEHDHVFLDFDPVEVHVPARSRSLEGERRTLSRRQILASLEEEEKSRVEDRNMEDSLFYPHFQTFTDGLEELPEDWEDSMEDISSVDDREDCQGGDGNSSCSDSGSYSGEKFSRCILLQSISKEEIRSVGLDHKTTTNGSTDDHSDENHNDNNIKDNNECDNQGTYSGCDNQELETETKVGSLHQISPKVGNLELKDLSWVGTLGIGGFGRVELVTAGLNNNLAFALKKLKKIEIQDEKHQQHIINEKLIMSSCSNPFIVKLYKTYKDTRYLYMLMEPCLGGELWTILRNKKRFDDESSRFYTACVIKAFEYLHDKGIVYRDLKPENLLLDSAGYVKLTDFGFSKKLEPGEKSWTFCGTPEYVAPEIITNKSHDYKADIWSVGILMYELLNGIPPFSKKNSTSSQVYSDILRGMKAVNFPSYMSATAVELIRQLCRLSPTQRPSLQITKKYMWFAGMDWKGLENRTLTPPHLPKITGVKDTSNFDNYGQEPVQPEEDFSDWDLEF